MDDSGWKGRSLRGNEKTRPPKTEPRDQGSQPQASPSALSALPPQAHSSFLLFPGVLSRLIPWAGVRVSLSLCQKPGGGSQSCTQAQ